jgi:hypothetical protein
MPKTRWFQFHDYSGIAITGDEPVTCFNRAMHMDRVVWLTAQLEAPKYGSVQGYDGAGISGGLLHNVAVLPKTMEQGDLWKLIRRVLDATARPARDVMLDLLAGAGWSITPDGVLRTASGLKVGGRAIRDVVSPLNGVVPKSGSNYDKALAWATALSDLFASGPEAHRAQTVFAAEWLARGKSSVELPVYQKFTGQPTLDSPIGLASSALPPEVDLAMAVYHSFSVNAPTPAAKALEGLSLTLSPEVFARGLIRRLGKTPFGRWQDEPGDGNNRYDRTRMAVWKCDLWDSAMARRLMPKDL